MVYMVVILGDKDTLHPHEAIDTLSDIEKILNYLDGNMTKEVSLSDVIYYAFNQGITKNIE